MPDPPKRICPGPGCRELISRGERRCPTCNAKDGQARRQQRVFAYDQRWWRAFRVRWFEQLVQLGIVPACGAMWPGGPVAVVTRCRAEGVLTFDALELHHWPPLSDDEVTDRAAICAGDRLVAACKPCHSAMTAAGAHR